MIAFFGAIAFCVCAAASLASLTDGDTSSMANGLILAGAAGIGLGLLLTSLFPSNRR